MPYLAFNLNNGNEFVFDLVEGHYFVGRHPLNEILIENLCVSNFHAELRRQASGDYEIIDLKSTGGTFINGKRIDCASLRPNDRVHFGPLQARYAVREPAAPRPGAEEDSIASPDLINQGGEAGEPCAATALTDVSESPKVVTAPCGAFDAAHLAAANQSEPPTVAISEGMGPTSDSIVPAASQSPSALVTRLGLNRPSPPEPQARPLELSRPPLPPVAEEMLPGLGVTTLIAKAPALAAAMDAGLSEERARMEKECEAARDELAEAESGGAGLTTVENTNPAALGMISLACADPQPTIGRADIQAPKGEMEKPDRATPEAATGKLHVEKSIIALESMERQLAEFKSTEQKTSERLSMHSHETEKILARLGKEFKQVEDKLSRVLEDNLRLTAHVGKFMTVLILAILLAMTLAFLWIDQILPSEIQVRMGAFGGAERGRPSTATTASADRVTEGLDGGVGTAAAVSAPSPLREDLTPSQRELVLLKERNRLTAYADEAIATAARTPYDRLWDTFHDPQLSNLVHAARAEILRVQSAYLSGSRIDRFDIPVGNYFPEDRALSDGQLKDGQLIKLLGDADNPWEVRMKAANLLGARHSMEVGDALVQAVKRDSNLDVVKEATFSFDQMTGFHGTLFDATALEQWWLQNKAKFQQPKPAVASPPVQKRSDSDVGTASRASTAP